ncbi:MAG TPA: aldo/keto reductase [Caulobacteraceae bacterium]|nr:aldo/keto reductase [Caulobacteraceae bacterium]
MDYVRLGNTGLKVSRLCLGCMTYGSSKWRPWVLDEESSLPFFKKALEAGINFFDTADVYSAGESERVTGKALKEYAKRHEVVLATKVHGAMGADANNSGLSRKHIMDAIDRSLHRLGVDYVDLYQIHRFDPQSPIEETLEALNDVVRAGKARYIGASSMYAWQFMKMLAASKAHGWARFVSMQPQYNLVYREEEREMLGLCLDQGIGVIPWSPGARGFLAGGRASPGEGNTERARSDEFSPRLYYREPDFAVVEALETIAKARGVSNMRIALAWVLNNPAVTAPIIGASKMSHLDDAIGALSITLTDDEVKALEKPYRPKPVLDHA